MPHPVGGGACRYSWGMRNSSRAVRRVLVVDDEPQVVWVIQFSLEAEGYETFTAHDGVEAMEQISANRPDLVVLDVMMPRMDGWSVLEAISKLPAESRPRVVMVTALASSIDRARAEQMGAAAYVPKPFDMDHLVGVLQGLELAS
jgi:DNA-binding response OmpR family regulator